MTQSPIIAVHPSKISLVQHYMDCADSLPLDVQRFLTELHEYDVEHRMKIQQIGLCIKNYTNEKSGPAKKKYLSKIQRLLIKSQHIGDEKLAIIGRIADLVENRTQLVTKYANEMNTPIQIKEEDFKTSFPLTPKMKVDKVKVSTPIEKSSKHSYEKPKRARRIRTNEKSSSRYNIPKDEDSRFSGSKDEEMEEVGEDETEDMEHENEAETKSKRDSIFRKKDANKSKYREENSDRKEDKKSDTKKDKVNKKSGKNSNKIKKRKKKEKELSNLDELAIDPDEPTYCICNSISYGDMIGCDNEECKIEWFHFGCVNLSHKPKGKWYCPSCTAERRELKHKNK